MLRGFVACLLIGSFLSVLAGCGGSSKKDRSHVPFRKLVARALNEPLAEVRAKKLTKIGYDQNKAGDRRGSEKTMELAKAACEAVTDQAVRAEVFAYLAETEGKLGHRSAARPAMESARQAAEKVEDKEAQARTLAKVGRVQGTLKNSKGQPETQKAVKILKTAEQLAAGLKDVSARTTTLCEVAEGYRQIGRTDDATRLFNAALEVAEKIADHRARCDAIAAIAAKQSGMKKAGWETFQLALQSAAKIKDVYSRIYAMADIAEKLSDAGFHAKAHELLKQAEELVGEIPEPDMQRRMLERVRTLRYTLPKPRG